MGKEEVQKWSKLGCKGPVSPLGKFVCHLDLQRISRLLIGPSPGKVHQQYWLCSPGYENRTLRVNVPSIGRPSGTTLQPHFSHSNTCNHILVTQTHATTYKSLLHLQPCFSHSYFCIHVLVTHTFATTF